MATLFCLFGWLSGGEYKTNPVDLANFRNDGWVDIVTVVVIWAYSIAVTIVIAIVYYLMNRIPALDNIGRKVRSKKDTDIENILAHVAKMAIEHEKDATGKNRYLLTTRAAEEEELMMRVPLAKKELKGVRAVQHRAGFSGGAMLDDFADDVADLVLLYRYRTGCDGLVECEHLFHGLHADAVEEASTEGFHPCEPVSGASANVAKIKISHSWVFRRNSICVYTNGLSIVSGQSSATLPAACIESAYLNPRTYRRQRGNSTEMSPCVLQMSRVIIH